MKKKIIDFLKSSKAKTFYWQTANGIIGLSIGFLISIKSGEVDARILAMIPVVISGLNILTKHINKTYLTK